MHDLLICHRRFSDGFDEIEGVCGLIQEIPEQAVTRGRFNWGMKRSWCPITLLATEVASLPG